ncbi:toxic anion resistance protein [Photorhabdus laumondii subsp. laumondii]|uniref:Photorhabdus luminescens subsp. laumondii TTO1 complete genome segment 14/17 n=2 Tax=Photorhabdus laumondii subsp. laumondii TaxID=141679 RepID=Q7MZV9_PHOLL|nr:MULTISPECIES: toxic anion resistance protein [Photorhabdus]AWK43734.1 Tellurite resistance protein [Photorhabdus laumondii subsp. laumondii]AXG44412.1 toxic anion resistance protein [Photorhabdus laumondii subsp. laumondii]AXG49043.1 toxic anion resistance protein [Photorhabdus laumondii subsp. laumondii]MCC8386457.1 toxic anion resistance protein [Photorhabdus laumondii]MCC8388797.1 toxic anion resistance protein [Photorhabdus laumondii]
MSTKVTPIPSFGRDMAINESTVLIDQEHINTLIEKIDISQPAAVIGYGAQPMGGIARFADTLLENVKTKEADEVGQKLSDLVMFIREHDALSPEEKSSRFLRKLPLIGGIFKKVERTMIDQKTLTQQVDTIATHLDSAMLNLLRDITVLDQLYDRNLGFYKEISLYVEAGKQKLRQIKTVELPSLQRKAETSQDMMDAQSVKDLLENINRFERRLHDLELSKTIAIQTAPQIRIVQNNNQQLAEKIQSSILSTLPIWKSQMVLNLSLKAQSRAAKLQKEVADTTNELLRKNAEILQQSSIATATEVERSIVDIETLRDVQSRLVNTIEDTMRIASEARIKRTEIEKELSSMEGNLRQRLTAAANAQY